MRTNLTRQAAAVPAAPPTADAVLAALDVQVPPVELPAAYGFALGALVAFLVLIPLAYVALLAFLVWLLVWHVFQAAVSIRYGPYFLFHVPMALLGGTLLLFLIKPVFFRRKDDDAGILVLRPADEPLLFAFVAKLCAATGARAPTIIEVDCEPNAGARLHHRGIAGALGKELVLRVGLPLAAAMPVRQFAGVLAHEFGHFNQRSGMTGAYLIRRLIAFFAKVVFQRDRLDEKVERMRAARSRLGRAIFWSAGWLIEAARGVLWLMLIVGELLTCGVLRRMEFDADHLEAHIAGTRDFVRTSKLLLFLSIAARRARADLADAWEQRRLADDLPRLIVAHAKQLAEHRDDILKLLEKEKTSWFDTHPCHADRVRNVEQTGAGGLVECDVAAKHLFANFDGLCRRATEAFYRSVIGADELKEGKLVPTSELVEQRSGERKSFDALRRFFHGGGAPSRPVLPAAEAVYAIAPGDEDAAITELSAARDHMVARAPAAATAAEQFESATARVAIARSKLLVSGIFYSAGAQKLRGGAEQEVRQHDPLRVRSAADLRPFEQAARHRLTIAIRLAQTAPWFDGDAEAADGPRGIGPLVQLCLALEPHMASVDRLRTFALQTRMFLSAYDDNNPYPPLVKRVLDTAQETTDLLRSIESSLSAFPYPFAHASAGVSVGRALIAKLPDPKDPVEAHAAALSAVDRLMDVTYRALAELTARAERVERGVGLDPLPEPPEKKREEDKEELAEEKRNTRRYWLGYGARATGGVAMVLALIVLSVSPPALPAMGWPSGDGQSSPRYAYRPASFGDRHAFNTDYRSYAPPPAPRDMMPGMPPNTFTWQNAPQRPTPGYTPPNYNPPGYNPPNYNRSQPNYGNPRPYQPPGGGGYSPPSYHPPGGGGYSPPSGGGGRR